MARVDPVSTKVVTAKSQVAELVRRLGSVNKASVALTEALGGGRAVYPNRLHVFLADDATKTVNARTFALIEEAVARLNSTTVFSEPEAPEVVRFTLSLVERWKASPRNEGALRSLAAELSQPVAVIRHTLSINGVLAELPVVGPGPSATLEKRSTPKGSRAPDYSFQDAAVDQCLAVFRRDSKRRAGVVVPTGGGKTEIGLRIALAVLKEKLDVGARVIWLTHRKALRDQARDRLQEMLTRKVKGLSPDDIRLVGEQIEFVMLNDFSAAIARYGADLRLIVIDEAHHAAAESYDPAFEIDPGVPVLALTATPNRTDGLPIRIDEIAFSITFRELTERGVILRPEIEPFQVDNFDWSDDAIDKLAGRILEGAGERYHKILIIAPQVDKVVRIHDVFRKRLSEEESSFFSPDDVHYISSHGNSAGTNNEAFLAEFRQKHNAIIVSAQLLLEGYDDPLIDTVVITYRTESVIMLMQAAGRCVRYSPGKTNAYVIQASDERIAYFFDHRWLYQDISDYPRPQLLDLAYSGPEDRAAQVSALLAAHSVPAERTDELLAQVGALPLATEFQFLLAGEPYYKEPADFDRLARWHACLLTPATRAVYVEVYNELCALGRRAAEIMPGNLVRAIAARHGIVESKAPNSDWVQLFSLALSLQSALMEVYGFDRDNYNPGGRRRPSNNATSWLKYACLAYKPSLSQEILDFTAEAVNADAVREDLIRNPGKFAALVRQPLPVGAYEVFCLTQPEFDYLVRLRNELASRLATVAGASRWGETRAWMLSQLQLGLPVRLAEYLGFLTRSECWSANVLSLIKP
jgi:superfamily II DNA or RNA helicase